MATAASRPPLPEAVRTAALRRPLIPPPSVPSAAPLPAPPPRLELRLVAIIDDATGLPAAAFVHDLIADEFLRLDIDQATGSGARLIAVSRRAATFDLAGRQHTLGLPE
ncbi:MAG: hypothetical protein ACTS3F_02490 [Phycisphaerales bacterium]